MVRKVDDSGELVTGARKHLTGHGLTVADLAGLNPEEASAITTKDRVWPVPDWAALHEAGIDDQALALIKIVRDRIPVAPNLMVKSQVNRTGDAVRQDYIRMVALIRDSFMEMRITEDATIAHRKVVDGTGWTKEKGWADPGVRALIGTVNISNKSPYYVTAHDIARAKKMVDAGFPNAGPVPAWRKGVSIGRDPRGGLLVAVRSRKIIAEGFATEAEGLAILKARWDEQKTERASAAKEPPSRAAVDDVRRGMPDWRQGRDISPEEFIAAFGFRAIQFGESMSDRERQQVTNMAYDGLMDMGHVLDIPPSAVSLDGFLAAAFGARGRGRHPAHYEPTQKIFNLGRKSGAGSLAHEWGHAFDHACGEANRSDLSRGDVRMVSMGAVDTSNLPAGAGDAWKHLMAVLVDKPRTKAEALQELTGRISTQTQTIEKERGRLDTFLKSDKRYYDITFERRLREWLTEADKRLKRFEDRLQALESSPEGTDFGKRNTDYVIEANKLCGISGDYWKRRQELFARAFECVVFDRIEAMGGNSPYLVAAVEPERYADIDLWRGNPYPTGDERKEFAKAMSAVLDLCTPVFGKDTTPVSGPGI